MSKELSQFCLSVSLFQEGKHSRERGREGASERRGEGGGGRAGRGWEETREAGRLRPGRRAATRTPHAVLAGSHAPAPRARSVRSEDPLPQPGGRRWRCCKKLLK